MWLIVLTSSSIQQHLLVWFTLSIHGQTLGCLDKSVSGVLYHLEGGRHVHLQLLILSTSHSLLPNLSGNRKEVDEYKLGHTQ